MTNNNMLDKVRKLLAKAEDPACTPAEAEAFNEKAAELIARYGIEQALLNATKAQSEREEVGDRIVFVPGPYAAEKSALLHNVAKPLRVRTVRRRTESRRVGYDVHMFGFPSDMERVELLFTSLLVQASHSLATIRSPLGERTTSFRKAWMWGFINSVHLRLAAAESRAEQEAQVRNEGASTALVLADRQALVDRRVEMFYPKIKKKTTSQVLLSGFRAGQAAGQRADLGGTRIANGPGRAIAQ